MSTEALLIGFFAALGATVLALGVALWLAHVHRPRGHIAAIAAFLLAFVATIGFAELLGQRYEFAPLPYRVHMPIAFATTLFSLAPLWSGWMHWQGKRTRERHQLLARVFLVGVVLSLGTGVWMLATGTRKDPAAAGVADGPG